MTDPAVGRPLDISEYCSIKNGLMECIDEMLAIEDVRGCPCEELREKLQKETFNLVVVGQFKRGKTSLINALLGDNILPVSVVPLTSIVTVMTYGEAQRVKVHFNDGNVIEIRPESLQDYVTEKGNPKNVKDVNEVVVTYPSPYLNDGVRLVDTPGVGSVYQHNTDVAYRYLPKSDAALFLLSTDQPLSRAEIDFLRDVREYSSKIFFLLNKADYFNDSELQESIEFSKGVLKDTLGVEVRIFPVSAKLALEGKLAASEETLRRSGLPRFTRVLNEFLMSDKGKVLALSVANSLLRLISQGRFELELELRSLASPIEEIRRKLNVFEEKKKAVMSEKQDFNILLDGKINEIVRNILEEDIDTFKKKLLEMLRKGLEDTYDANQSLPAKALRDVLESYIIDTVRESYNGWRALEDSRLQTAFEEEAKRFTSRIDDIVDELLRFSSELFSVPYEAVKAESLWAEKSGLYYKFRDEPVGLEMLTSSATLALPSFIGKRIIMRGMRDFLTEVIDRQAGRLRHDFASRLDKSKLGFRWAMLQRIESTIEGIETAITRGINQKTKGEAEAEERRSAIVEKAERLSELSDKLVALKELARGGPNS